MNLDELFDQAARVAEPGLPADVLGGVRRAQAQRRRHQLIAVPVACLVIAAGVLVPTVLFQRDGAAPGPLTTAPPTTAPPTTPPARPAPTVLVGINGDHAVRVDLSTGARTDLGKAVAVTAHAGLPWLARPKAPCETSVITPTGSFDAHGDVRGMEVSPDGKTLAYIREIGPPPSDYNDNLRCGAAFLVLRDVATGVERTWAGDDANLGSLTWSADGRQVAFSINYCCGDDDPLVRVLDTSGPSGDVDAATELPRVTPVECSPRFPVFAGNLLLLGVQCNRDASPTDAGPVTFELRDAHTDQVLRALPANLAALTSDASGQHLLAYVSTQDTPQPHLLAISLRDASQRELTPSLADPHW
jgi:dipeptidyl aminopeptidase/acylaminoacyl peptidase